MDLSSPNVRLTPGPAKDDVASASMQGWRLFLARAVWLLLATAIVAVFVVGLTKYYGQILSLTDPPAVVNPRLALLLVPDPIKMRAGLRELGLSPELYATVLMAQQIGFALSFVVVGFVIFWRKSNQLVAWSHSLFLVSFILASPNVINALAQSAPAWRSWLYIASAGALCAFLIIFPFIFPDGKFVPRWGKWMVVPILVLAWLYGAAPGFLLLLPANWLDLMQAVALILFLLSAVAGPVYRYRNIASPSQRQQMKWFVYGVSAAMAGFVVTVSPVVTTPLLMQSGSARIVSDLVAGTIITLTLSLIPLSICVAIFRYHLWDIDVLISRTLVYGALTAIVVGLYTLIVGYLGVILRTGGNLFISLAATGVVAVLFQPLRAWLQRGVNRLIFGQRDDPRGVLARLDARLAEALPAEAALSTIVETLVSALKLPYAAISVGRDERIVAERGTPSGTSQRLPLTYSAEVLGHLYLAPRQGESRFTAADRHLFEDLANHAGVVVHAVQLTDDLRRSNFELQASRERLVTAREEERRRLRRDLHDGLGPTLAALALKADTVGELVPAQPGQAQVLARELNGDIRATINEIRRLVYALRPPILDELGFLAAMKECVEQYLEVPGAPAITHSLPSHIPPLPAAVEVAALRITQEALTNVVRHASAQTCSMSLAVSDAELRLAIVDDGVGMPPQAHAGVGLRSMRERGEEVGGSCVIGTGPSGGVRVDVSLPLASPGAPVFSSSHASEVH